MDVRGPSAQLWMADSNPFGQSRRILRWLLATNGVCASNDLGLTVVAANGGLTSFPSDVALDAAGNIYVCQPIGTPGDSAARVFRFPAYDPSTNGGQPELTATWAVGQTNDNYGQASGIAVDPTGTYVAVSFQGVNSDFGLANGNTKVLYATNGAVAAELDLGLTISGSAHHQDLACAWDAVGNVYYYDYWAGFWRAVSPPGTNHATTLAPAQIVIAAPPPPVIVHVTQVGNYVLLDFSGAASDTPANFAVFSSPVVIGPYSAVPGVTITNLSPGLFRATFISPGSMQYYRVARVAAPPPAPPYITGLGVAGGTVTLTFTGSSADTPSAFTLLSAANPTDL